MARLRGPMDVEQVAVRNTRRVIEIQASPEAATNARIGRATLEILNTARDQQIENDVATAELTTRRELDELRAELDKDPDNSTLAQRWDEGSAEIVERNSANLSSPMHQQLWRERSMQTLANERRSIVELQQQRTVEAARAGLIQAVGLAEQTLTDENATPEARASAMSVIETSIRRARDRRTIGADDAERMLQAARNRVAEYERTQGMIARAQAEEDRIWAESGGDYAVAQEMARELIGTMRDTVEDRLATRFNRDEAGRREALDDAMEEAYAAIEAGRSIDQLPQAMRDVITRAGQMDTLRNYRDARNGGPGGIAAHERRSGVVRDVVLGASADRERASVIANLNLSAPLTAEGARALGYPEGTNLRAALTQNDYNELIERQREMRGEGGASGEPNAIINNTFNNRLLPHARRLAALARVNVQQSNGMSDESQDIRRRRAAFEAYLYSELRAHVQAYNAAPNDAQIDAIARSALTQSSGGGVWGIGRTTRRRFEASSDTPVDVPYSNILPAQRQRLERAWARAGNTEPPTPAQIERMYAEELAGLGE